MDANELEAQRLHDERKNNERIIELRARRAAILQTIREGSEWGHHEVEAIEAELERMQRDWIDPWAWPEPRAKA